MKNQGIRQEKQKGFFQMIIFWRSCAACSIFGVDVLPVTRPAGIRDQKEKHERPEKADQEKETTEGKTIHNEKTKSKFSGGLFPSVSVNLSTHGVFRQFLLTHREIIPPWVCRQPIRSRVSDISGNPLYCKNPANF